MVFAWQLGAELECWDLAWQHETEQEAVREVGYRCPLLLSLTLCLPSMYET